MNAQQLKNSILQMAVSGKLVPQDPNDEPASVLLERIRAEKEELIRAGKIKREKNPSYIFRGPDNAFYEKIGDKEPVSIADEVPFEIPDSWEWCRISSISAVVTKGTTPRGGNVAYLDAGIGFLRAENVAGLDKLDKKSLNYIDETTHNEFLKRSILESNDILITIAGTLGRTALVRKDDLPLNANQAISIIRPVDTVDVDLLYVIYALNSPVIQKFLTTQKKITAIPNLTLEIISECLIPVPPLSEQHRIVKKTKEIVPYVEKYAVTEIHLDSLNTQFPNQLKKSILQQAVQGKLAPQDPEDEPASVLLERIRAEKEELIRAGKIKREKNPSYIFRGSDNAFYEQIGDKEPVSIADEIPFDIPDSWEWVRLGNIFYHNTGKALNASNQTGQLLEYITTSNLYWNRFELDSLRQMYFTDEEIEKCTAKKGDLLVCEGGEIGRAAIWPYEYDIRIQNHIHRLRAYVPVCTHFYYYIFYLYKNVGWIGGKGIGIQGLSSNALHVLLFPLPPLSEQHRIVEKIEELMPMIKAL
ncbi:MAG: restriction endonuclease subunit S [Flexilinea sp.]|nr:restriction endonuclease subunit S [Flexilinea sp.]